MKFTIYVQLIRYMNDELRIREKREGSERVEVPAWLA